MIFLGLGSNLGDRRANLLAALSQLDAHEAVRVERVSSLYETEPFGYKAQGAFLNAVAQLGTSLAPLELLRLCQDVETRLGRRRETHWGPRAIDLDLLLFGAVRMRSEALTLPHPWLHRRRFVLVPLAEIAEGPLLGDLTAGELLARCEDDGAVCLYEKIAWPLAGNGGRA